MTDLNRLADLLLPGIRNAQLKLEEVSNYLGVMPDSLRQYNGWQPIETAPKDGTFILVAVPGEVAIHIMLVWWLDGWCLDMTNTPIVGNPTHWMPLPEPPKEGK